MRRQSEKAIRGLNAELEARVAERTRQAEESRAYLDMILAATPEVIFSGRVGLGLVTDFVSQSAQRLFGYDPAEITGDPGWWASHIEPADFEAALTRMSTARAEGAAEVGFEARVLVKDGAFRWFLVSLRFRDSEPPSFVGSATDLTDRKKAEEELARARLEAERASRAKGEFLSSVSHDLRTPLNAVLGFGQLLQMSDLAPRDRDGVEQILRAGRQLLAMIDDILEFTRVDAGRMVLSIESVDVADAVDETLDLLRPLGLERVVQIDHLSGSDAGLAVLCDRGRLVQILRTFVTNGITFNREGGSVTVTAEPVDEDCVRITVRDSGIGIAPERLPRIFEPFEADHRRQTGTRTAGLGLAVSSRLARAMGGSVAAASEVGRGSTFTLELPRADSPLTGGVELAGRGADDRPMRTILYIEDNVSNITLISRLLGRGGNIRVLAAMQSALGLEMAREHLPDLILLDLRLPDAAPDVTLRALKADERTRDIPVIILSSEETPSRMLEMQAIGASDYITKPIDVAAFIAVIDHILGGG